MTNTSALNKSTRPSLKLIARSSTHPEAAWKSIGLEFECLSVRTKNAYRRTGNYWIIWARKPVIQNDFGRIRAEIQKLPKISSQIGKLIQYRPSQISSEIQYLQVFRTHEFGTMSTNNFFSSHQPVIRHVVPSQTNTTRNYCHMLTSKMQKFVPFFVLEVV